MLFRSPPLMLPGHSNLLPIHCIAVIARWRFSVHGHPVDPPINRGPELQLEPTPPLHSTKTLPSHWKNPEEVSFLNSGRRDPPRDPARFAPVRAPLPPISCQLLSSASLLLTRASIRSLQASTGVLHPHPSCRPPEKVSPSTWCSPLVESTTHRRGRTS